MQIVLGVIVGFVAALVIVALATLICILCLLLLPGRKGYISETSQRTFYHVSVEAMIDDFVGRLQQLAFVIDSIESNRLTATRPRRPIKHRDCELYDCESAKLNAYVRFSKSLQDVNVELTLQSGGFILYDSYETNYLKKLGDEPCFRRILLGQGTDCCQKVSYMVSPLHKWLAWIGAGSFAVDTVVAKFSWHTLLYPAYDWLARFFDGRYRESRGRGRGDIFRSPEEIVSCSDRRRVDPARVGNTPFSLGSVLSLDDRSLCTDVAVPAVFA